MFLAKIDRGFAMSPFIELQTLFARPVYNGIAISVFLILLVCLSNVLQQVLLKKRNEPPLVFHWLPVIGSTVSYGLDPFKFFFECQAKVGSSTLYRHQLRIAY